MLKKYFFTLALCGFFLNAISQEQPKDKEAYRAPAAFTENKGQIVDNEGVLHPEIKFTAEVNGIQLYFKADGVSYIFSERKADQTNYYRTDLEFVQSDSKVRISGEEKQECTKNFYLGQCPQGITNVGAYSRITYHNLYKGIDLEYFIGEKGLKYQYVVHPGADASVIRMRFKAADKVEIDEENGLTVTTPIGKIRDAWPVSFTQENHVAVKSGFVLKDAMLSFSNADYDKTQTLIIDPFIRFWGTYLGGVSEDTIKAVAYYANSVPANAAIYVTGTTTSTTYISTAGAFSISNHGATDVFVSRFNTSGGITWSTYYGGGYGDYATCIAANSTGVVAGGYTNSPTGIATSGTHLSTKNSTGGTDGFVVKFNTNGTRSWGTYYGGPGSNNYPLIGSDVITGIDMDNFNNVAICGNSSSTQNIASVGSFQPSYITPAIGQYTPNGFVAKFTSAGVRSWGSYYNWTTLNDVKILNGGRIAVTGKTGNNAIMLNASQAVSGGQFDAFLGVLISTGAGLSFATYYGGNSLDEAMAIDEDAAYNICITGNTMSTIGIATAGAHQSTMNGVVDAFVAKYSSSGTKLWSTYLGGPGADGAQSISIINSNEIFIAGYTNGFGPALSSFDAMKTHLADDEHTDGFISKFTSSGTLAHSTYYGSTHDNFSTTWPEMITGIAVDDIGHIVVVGYSDSQNTTDPNDFPLATSGSHQATSPNAVNGYGTNGFIGWLIDNEIKVTALAPLAVCPGAVLTISFSMLHWEYQHAIHAELSSSNGSFAAPVWLGSTVASYPTGNFAVTIPMSTVPGTNYKVRLYMIAPWGAYNIMGPAFGTNLTVKSKPDTPTASSNSPVCIGQTIYLTTPPGLGASYAWTGPNAFSAIWQNPSIPNASAIHSGTYSLTLTLSGCTSLPGTTTVFVSQPPSSQQISASGPTKLCEGGVLILSVPQVAGCIYQWLLDGNDIPNATQATYQPTVSGSYRVRISILNNACSAYSNTEGVTFYPCRMAQNSVDEDSNSPAVIYPNPSDGIIIIGILNADPSASFEIMIYNSTGQLIYDEIESGGGNAQLDLSSYANGIYLVKVKSGNTISESKIILNK